MSRGSLAGGTLADTLLDGLGLRESSRRPRISVFETGTELGRRVYDGLDAVGLPVEPIDGETADGRSDPPADVAVCPHDPPLAEAFERLAELREARPETEVVVVTEIHDPKVTTRALDAGAADCAALGNGGDAVLTRRVARLCGVDPDGPLPDPDGRGADPSRITEIVAAFNEVTGELNEARTVDEVARVTATAANEVLDFPGTSARFYNETDHTLEVASLGGTVSGIDARPPYPVDDSPHGEAFERQETIVEAIGDDDPYDREVFCRTMYVPIGRYGTISVGIEEGEFSELDVLLTELLAKNTRNAFAQAERERQLAETALRVGEFADEVADAGTAVTGAVERVRAASEEVTESVDEIATGAAEQSDELQGVLEELDDLLDTVDETVATADDVARQSRQTADLARQGTERADVAMDEMSRIEARTEAMVADIRGLGEEIERVSEIAEFIEEVAEQTNVLALNASIEAARAGEAGQGFAVVADEIKELAEETRESTDEIGTIVRTVTERTERTVAEMERMRADVDESVGTVADALTALEGIGEHVEATNDDVQEISRVVAEQSTTLEGTVGVAERVGAISEEVANQTSSVAEAVHEQATTLEHVTENARQLESMAADLHEMTGEFSVPEAVATAARSDDAGERDAG